MKKFIIVLGIIFIVSQSVFATELQGGISYTVDSAREYIQQGQVNDIGPQGHLYYDGNSYNADVIYGYNSNNVPIGFDVRFKDDLTISYTYGMDNRLRSIAKYDKPSDTYPHRGYIYNTGGKLIKTTLMVSKNNGFAFTPNGKLITHMVNGIGYLGNTNIIVYRQSGY
ncbi:MAG: hypothetical protein WCY19_04985 [Candidatus Gastranaerophilaceae bacterium]